MTPPVHPEAGWALTQGPFGNRVTRLPKCSLIGIILTNETISFSIMFFTGVSTSSLTGFIGQILGLANMRQKSLISLREVEVMRRWSSSQLWPDARQWLRATLSPGALSTPLPGTSS